MQQLELQGMLMLGILTIMMVLHEAAVVAQQSRAAAVRLARAVRLGGGSSISSAACAARVDHKRDYEVVASATCAVGL
jgi:hypothetical protein